ncbi:MAG TPA: MATE family efflux transporter, partial [Tepidisphaeraceae bacterium]|nr:MATE family efflux transporter [Tepidisphaeraceae bacterium]
MSQVAIKPIEYAPAQPGLARQLLALALPVFAENALHMVVGLNDTYLANKLPHNAAAAGAAVGTVTYLLWFFNLLVSAVAAGSTAIISRAKGARHRRQANSVTGQSITVGLFMGVGVGVLMFVFARQVIESSGLSESASRFALPYLKMLSVTLPFLLTMSIASACLRGNGNTLAPAIALIVVDIVNVIFSWGLCRGIWGMPKLGFNGIALGTIIAYVVGGVLQFVVLLSGVAGLRLYWHRLLPHATMIRRLFKIGLPAGVESLLNWLANFGVIYIINRLDATNAFANAHMNAVRIESISFMTGFAFAAAAATMVGQSLGMKDPQRARQSAYLAYAMGGGAMTLIGVFFIFFGSIPARMISPDPHIAELTARCLFITGFIQSGFAAYAVFAGALRGAGDTFFVMLFSLVSVLFLRLIGVIIVGGILHKGLGAIWVVLAAELFCRGLLAFGRFL